MLFVGLPGSGKTTTANMMHKIVGGARINADQVRASISTDLKFTEEDRLIQAHRVGALSGLALRPYALSQTISKETQDRLNKIAVVDFVCPNDKMHTEFLYSARFFGLPPINIVTVWMNTIQPEDSRFADTARMYQPPSRPDHTITGFQSHEQLERVVLDLARAYNLPLKE
jgi:hypothetical protein